MPSLPFPQQTGPWSHVMIVPCCVCGEMARAVYHCLDRNCGTCAGEPMPSFCSSECRDRQKESDMKQMEEILWG